MSDDDLQIVALNVSYKNFMTLASLKIAMLLLVICFMLIRHSDMIVKNFNSLHYTMTYLCWDFLCRHL